MPNIQASNLLCGLQQVPPPLYSLWCPWEPVSTGPALPGGLWNLALGKEAIDAWD